MEPRLKPRKRPRQRRSKATVAVILEGAARVLAREGLARTTTNRVATAAGVSVGSIYQYFPNKDAILLALARRHAEAMLAALQTGALAQLDEPVPVVVRSFVAANIAVHRMDPALHVGLLQVQLGVGLELALQVQDTAVELVAGWLQSRSADLNLGDVHHVAFLLVTTVESAVHAALLSDGRRLEDAAFEEELVALILRYIMNSRRGD